MNQAIPFNSESSMKIRSRKKSQFWSDERTHLFEHHLILIMEHSLRLIPLSMFHTNLMTELSATNAPSCPSHANMTRTFVDAKYQIDKNNIDVCYVMQMYSYRILLLQSARELVFLQGWPSSHVYGRKPGKQVYKYKFQSRPAVRGSGGRLA